MSANHEIDRICDDFEAVWSAGTQPELRAFIEILPVVHRDMLLESLIPIDVEYRMRHCFPVKPNDYADYGRMATEIAARSIADNLPASSGVSAAERFLQETNVPSDFALNLSQTDSQILDSFQTAVSVDDPSPAIGPYKILQQIGKGGMGVVFMAEQTEPVRRKVALKLIKAGMDTKEVIARFEAERQALALMDHPNIAKVLDAGSTQDGRPFFVMELVKGIPVTKYCDDHLLSIEDRLELFVQACRAIQHAHHKGIIHRDITARNVLVTQHDGVPCVKVIDFGLAKALSEATLLTERTMFTQFGQVIGTFQYMSPEQAELNTLDVDTRTDVYSLGVLLFEILTGSTPLEKQRLNNLAIDRVLAAIRTEEAPRASTRIGSSGERATTISAQRRSDVKKLTLLLKGDLDWIVMKALDKERSRRYDSPAQMADDVRRFLNHDVIMARPPSFGYLLKKGLRRHRYAAIASAAVATALLVGLATTLQQLMRAHEAERLTREKSDQVSVLNTDLEVRNRQLKHQIGAASLQTGLRSLSEQRYEEGWAWLSQAYRELPEESVLRRSCRNHLNAVQSLEWAINQQSSINASATSPDGQFLVLGDYDGIVQLWRIDSGRAVGSPWRLGGPVRAVAFSPDGTFVLAGSANGIIARWNVRDGSELAPPWDQQAGVSSLCFDPQGRLVATGYRDGTTKIWDVQTHAILGATLWHRDPDVASATDGDEVTEVLFSPDGRWLLTVSKDGYVNRWEVATGQLTGMPWKHDGQVDDIAWHPDGRRVVTASGGSVRIWNLEGDEPSKLPQEIDSSVLSVAFSPDGTTGAAGSADGYVRFWDVASGLLHPPSFKNPAFVSHLKFHTSGLSIVAAGRTGSPAPSGAYARVWNIHCNEAVQVLATHEGEILDLDLSRDGRRLVAVWSGKFTRIVDVETGETISKPILDTDGSFAVAMSPDGRSVAAVNDEQFQLWDVDHGTFVERPVALDAFALAFSPDGLHVAVGGYGVRLFGVVNTQFSNHEFMHADAVLAIAFSPNGKSFFTGCMDGAVRQWNVESGVMINDPWRNRQGVDSIDVSPNGQRVVAGCRDGLVRLWDVESGTVIGEPWKHDAAVLGIQFSPDGGRVATSCHDGRVRQWDVETATAIGEPWIHPNIVHAVAFTADGQQVLTGCYDGKIRIWDAVSPSPIDIDDAEIRGGQIIENGRLRDLTVSERAERRQDSPGQ